jgi:hypothetical protein
LVMCMQKLTSHVVASTILHNVKLEAAARTWAWIRVFLKVRFARKFFFGGRSRLTFQACVVLLTGPAIVEGDVVICAVAMSTVCVAACEDIAVILVVDLDGDAAGRDALTITRDLTGFLLGE